MALTVLKELTLWLEIYFRLGTLNTIPYRSPAYYWENVKVRIGYFGEMNRKQNFLFNWLIVLVGVHFLQGQAMEFVKEELNFYLDRRSFVVQGVYFFSNQEERAFQGAVWYPFPDSNVSNIQAYDEKFQKIAVSLQKEKQWGTRIPLQMAAGDSTFIIVRYLQKVNGNHVKYIVTSTLQWLKPLKEARFQLVVDPGIQQINFSFPPNSEKYLNGKYVYQWQFKNFYPKRDFVINFK